MNISVSFIIDDHTQDGNVLKVTDVSLKDTSTISDLLNMYKQPYCDIYVICRGEVVNNCLRVMDIGITDGSVLKLVIKKRTKTPEVLYNEESIKEIIKKHRQMMKTRYKQVLNESLEHGLDSVTDHDFGLEKDLLAFSIASDYRLLRTLLSSTENVAKLLQECPVLIPAALKIVNMIQDKLKKAATHHVAESDHDARYFSLGEVEVSDASSEEEDGGPETESSSQSVSSVPAAISRAQLRQAISSVGGDSRVQPHVGAVSLAQLRTAIHSAIGSHEPMEVDEAPSAVVAAPASDGQLADKISQLVAMGFTDTAANKAALEATAGDVEAAVELLL